MRRKYDERSLNHRSAERVISRSLAFPRSNKFILLKVHFLRLMILH